MLACPFPSFKPIWQDWVRGKFSLETHNASTQHFTGRFLHLTSLIVFAWIVHVQQNRTKLIRMCQVPDPKVNELPEVVSDVSSKTAHHAVNSVNVNLAKEWFAKGIFGDPTGGSEGHASSSVVLDCLWKQIKNAVFCPIMRLRATKGTLEDAVKQELVAPGCPCLTTGISIGYGYLLQTPQAIKHHFAVCLFVFVCCAMQLFLHLCAVSRAYFVILTGKRPEACWRTVACRDKLIPGLTGASQTWRLDSIAWQRPWIEDFVIKHNLPPQLFACPPAKCVKWVIWSGLRGPGGMGERQS